MEDDWKFELLCGFRVLGSCLFAYQLGLASGKGQGKVKRKKPAPKCQAKQPEIALFSFHEEEGTIYQQAFLN